MTMEPTDLTVKILTEIRDSIQGTNSRLDQTNERLDQTNERLDRTRVEFSAKLDETNARLDQTNARLDQTNERLDRTRVEFSAKLDETNARLDETNARLDQTNERLGSLSDRVVEAEVRTATAIMRLSGTLDDVKSMLRENLDLSTRVMRCETDIQNLKQRIGAG